MSFSLSNLAGKPIKLATGVGSTQSTLAGTPFPIRLAVTVTDAEKNPVPGALVTFSAPAARRALHSPLSRLSPPPHPCLLRPHGQGQDQRLRDRRAPAFTASTQPGGYIVRATAEHARAAAFALVNEAP